MSLYKQIRENFILPNAFEDWRAYRNTLTKYLIKEVDSVSLPLEFSSNTDLEEHLPTLAIIGAGACNDIDLARIKNHFSKITLIDCNEAALHQALTTYDLTEADNVELKNISLTGITDSDYEEFCEELQAYIQLNQQTFSMEEFEEFALSKLKSIYEKRRQAELPLISTYDYIWCFGVHSQLQAMFSYICHAFFVNLKEMFPSPLNDFIKINEYLKSENDRFIPHFHDVLLSCAKKSVFLGMEQQRISTSEAVNGEANNTCESDSIEGAYQGILDIRSRNLNVTESSILWPFYPEKDIAYHMLVQTIMV